jgi:hypothetical protein
MPPESNQEIARAFVQLTKRAETADPATLVQTFVDIGTLLPSISTKDNQVIFGRRGTGKTHALVYALEKSKLAGATTVYVDLRTAGSSTSVYSNPKIPIPERATRLLLDVLSFIHDEITSVILANQNVNLSIMGPLLDALGENITEVSVEGDVSVEQQIGATSSIEGDIGSSLVLSGAPSLTLTSSEKDTRSATTNRKVTAAGALTHHVHFGALSSSLTKVLQALPNKQLIIALDEWVAVPYELQPYLADLLRRALFPIRGVSIKIAAIEQRSTFKLKGANRDYIGIEVGGDVSTAINLDDFMVFENDEDRATTFLSDLVFKHYRAEVPQSQISSAEELVRVAFTQSNAFVELVKAAEGVPRDAINILSIAAQKASDRKISVPDIRGAARSWYQRGKEATVNSDPEAQRLLHWIIDKVIGERRSRAFLLLAGTQHPLVDTLFDERVLHVIKRGLSTRDQPGVRYDAYKIDYGTYVDLMATDRAPLGLMVLDDEATFVNVPPDDYRVIRRAILDIAKFETIQTLLSDETPLPNELEPGFSTLA